MIQNINQILKRKIKMIYENKVSKEFAEKVKQIATALHIQPDWLMMVMYKETGGTFSASVKNPTSSATGLIQFMENTAQRMGTTTRALASLSAVEQLDWVYKYLSNFKGRMNSFGDVYLAVFYPNGIGALDSVKFPKWVYNANRGIDMNKDGILTIGEFKKWALKGQEKIFPTDKEVQIELAFGALLAIVLISYFA